MQNYDFEIEIDDIPPSINHCYITTKSGMRVLKKSAKDFLEYVRVLTKAKARKEKFVMRAEKKFFVMEIEFTFPNYRFPDPNNLIKVLIDAFEGIIFKNDKYCLPNIKKAEVKKNVKKTIVRFKF